jgi:hypothetical protein
MLVEGGYLHSMKLMLEKAAETPDPTSAHEGSKPAHPRTAALVRSIKRLFARVIGF